MYDTSDWKKYVSYDLPVDPKQSDKATAIKLLSFRRPHMRAFHFAWFGFCMAFVCWFAFAPLMNVIMEDLSMTKAEVYDANISSVASTVLSRLIVGPFCDTYGARLISSSLLIMGAIPTAFGGLVQSATDVTAIRFFVGIMGATFVCNQYWSSQMFAKEIVGTANATAAGWGSLGGGVAQIFMIVIWRAFATKYDAETAWRLSFLVPAAIVMVVAVGQVFLTDDCPKGNYNDLIANNAMVRTNSSTSFKKPPVLLRIGNQTALNSRRTIFFPTLFDTVPFLPLSMANDYTAQGYLNFNSWVMFVQYAACFGVELTINNTAAAYFEDNFGLSMEKAGLVASLFGLMNVFSRSLGGFYSGRILLLIILAVAAVFYVTQDCLNMWFGSGVTGMRGRFIAQWTALLWEGVFLCVFSRQTELVPAIACLLLFALGVQAAEGTSYSIVPYICPQATGAVSGIVGAGGNLGATIWGLIFRFGPAVEQEVYLILGVIVIGLSMITPLFNIRGYDTMFTKVKGEKQMALPLP